MISRLNTPNQACPELASGLRDETTDTCLPTSYKCCNLYCSLCNSIIPKPVYCAVRVDNYKKIIIFFTLFVLPLHTFEIRSRDMTRAAP